jgi:hypothetical protein
MLPDRREDSTTSPSSFSLAAVPSRWQAVCGFPSSKFYPPRFGLEKTINMSSWLWEEKLGKSCAHQWLALEWLS